MRSARLAELEGAELNDAKKVLATEATALVHGRDAADRAAETARATFEEGEIAASLPTFEHPGGAARAGLGVLTANILRVSFSRPARHDARSRAAGSR